MGNKLVWLRQAYDDLSAPHEYISADNGRAADAYVEDILTACERLSEFPLSGRFYNSVYRALIIRNHLVFYRFDENEGRYLLSRFFMATGISPLFSRQMKPMLTENRKR